MAFSVFNHPFLMAAAIKMATLAGKIPNFRQRVYQSN